MNLVALWVSIPAPIRTATVSALLTVNTVLGTAWALSGAPFDFSVYVVYLEGHWFGLMMGAIYGSTASSSLRAHQSLNASFPTSPQPPQLSQPPKG